MSRIKHYGTLETWDAPEAHEDGPSYNQMREATVESVLKEREAHFRWENPVRTPAEVGESSEPPEPTVGRQAVSDIARKNIPTRAIRRVLMGTVWAQVLG